MLLRCLQFTVSGGTSSFMACMAHVCKDCSAQWEDNRHLSLCPKCGSGDIETVFDEMPHDFIDNDDSEVNQ